jgi:hypothetical protein
MNASGQVTIDLSTGFVQSDVQPLIGGDIQIGS